MPLARSARQQRLIWRGWRPNTPNSGITNTERLDVQYHAGRQQLLRFVTQFVPQVRRRPRLCALSYMSPIDAFGPPSGLTNTIFTIDFRRIVTDDLRTGFRFLRRTQRFMDLLIPGTAIAS
jgi:hypothetical protein